MENKNEENFLKFNIVVQEINDVVAFCMCY